MGSMTPPAQAGSQQPAPVYLFLLPSQALRSGQGVSWLAYVGLAEQIRAAEFTHPDEALAYASQQTLMRCLAASRLGVKATQAAEIPVDRSCSLCQAQGPANLHGKPKISGVNLSMARSLSLVLGALGPQDLELGVDVIAFKPGFYDNFDSIALLDQEKERLATLSDQQAQIARHLFWAGKEAVLKSSGYGLALAPRQVELILPQLPQDFSQIEGLTGQALAYLPGRAEPLSYWISYQAYQDSHLLALATDRPHRPISQLVSTPLMVRRALEGVSL